MKTIQGDHVEIIYICTRQSACSVHYACLSVEVCQSPRLQCDQPRFPAAAPRWPPHPVLAESFTNYISISVSPVEMLIGVKSHSREHPFKKRSRSIHPKNPLKVSNNFTVAFTIFREGAYTSAFSLLKASNRAVTLKNILRQYLKYALNPFSHLKLGHLSTKIFSSSS